MQITSGQRSLEFRVLRTFSALEFFGVPGSAVREVFVVIGLVFVSSESA